MRKSDFETFLNKFKPHESVDTTLKEYDYNDVKDINPQHIWTMIEGDSGRWYIVPGYHIVNRLMYLITEHPWKEGQRDYYFL